MADTLAAINTALRAWLNELRRHTVAGPELRQRLACGAERHPSGHALVTAAVDCWSAGWRAPIPRLQLMDLALRYQPPRNGQPPDSLDLADGLAWACSQSVDRLPLLLDDGGVYRPSPGLTGGSRQVPSHIRPWLLANAPGDCLLQIAVCAQADGDLKMTEQAFMRAIAIGEAHIQAAAWVGLGELRGAQGAYADAIEAFRLADTDALPSPSREMAWFSLGLCHDKLGQYEQAEALYRRAIEAGDTPARPLAGFNLGLLLGALRDPDSAEAAFAHAINAPGYADRPLALHVLGMTLMSFGQYERALPYLERAAACRHHDIAAKSAESVGILYRHRERLAEAEAACETIAPGDVSATTETIWCYAELAFMQDSRIDLAALCRPLLDRLPAEETAAVAVELAERLYSFDKAAAVELAERAMTAADPWCAAEASLLRGRIARNGDDLDTAMGAFQRTLALGSLEQRAQATLETALVHARQGRHEQALELFSAVHGHPLSSVFAEFNQAVVLEGLDRLDEARLRYEAVIEAAESHDPEDTDVLFWAIACLHHLLTRMGRTTDAQALTAHWERDDPDDPYLAMNVAEWRQRRYGAEAPPFVYEPW